MTDTERENINAAFPDAESAVDWIRTNGGNRIRTDELVLGDMTVWPSAGALTICVNDGETFSTDRICISELVVRNVVGEIVAEPRDQWLDGGAR